MSPALVGGFFTTYAMWEAPHTPVVIQLLIHGQPFVTPWTAACQASLPFSITLSLLKLMSIESLMPSNHLILCHPLCLLLSTFPSFRVFSNELALCIRWPKCWSFSLSISPSNEYSGLISFRMDWFDLLGIQGTLKSLLQNHSLLLLSCFSRVQLCGTLQMAAHQALPSLGFSRQEHWSRLPFPSPMHESESEVAQ